MSYTLSDASPALHRKQARYCIENNRTTPPLFSASTSASYIALAKNYFHCSKDHCYFITLVANR